MSRFFPTTLTTLLVAAGVSLGAQQPAPAQPNVADSTIAERHEIANDKNHHYIGKVEFELGDSKIYADEAWFYSDENRFLATGNVLFSQGANRIASDKADFNTMTHLGTFYNATGIATVQPPRQSPLPGAIAVPQLAGRKRTSISSATRSRSSGRRNTGSPTAGSPPACSRRRAGTCTPTPSS